MNRNGAGLSRGPGRKGGPAGARLCIGLAVALVLGGCTSEGGPSGASAEGPPQVDQPKLIGQPVVPAGLQVAPDAQRVDIRVPTFSDPANVTNPLHPTGLVESILMVGTVDGKAFRTEVTLLPDTRIIEWQGQQVETLVSQYVAFLDGRIHEVAYDFYAQADDGSVWYFGEDVFNFKDGVIADTHGTWIAGKDGPAAMIMPAAPTVGDVYRPENIPGFVFEEVTVTSVGRSLEGPLGPVDGGLVIEELHMDGATEDKTFAPGYGEFYTAGGGDVEALAMAVPTDSLAGPPPGELSTLEDGAVDVYEAARSSEWKKASAEIDQMTAAWESHRASEVPKMIEPRLSGALEALAQAVGARNSAQARQAAIDTAQWSLDLQLRHRPAVEVDIARFDLWAAQLLLDAEEGDSAAANGDFFTLDYIRDRILHALDGVDVTRINIELEELQGTVGDGDLSAAAGAVEQLRDTLAGVEPLS